MESRLSRFQTDDQILVEGLKLLNDVQSEIARFVFGDEIRKLVEFLLMAGLANGHVLIRAHLGIGKTKTCRALARAIAGVAKRSQFRPDMLPSEISGYKVWNPKTETWEIRHGPLFGTNIYLADEINRAGPKTQSALLEAMEERVLSIEGEGYPLEPLFLVLATRNPIEHEGTYELPEAQLDRFFGQPGIDYPSEETQLQVLKGDDKEAWAEDRELLNRITPKMTPEDILILRKAIVKDIYVDEEIMRYAIRLGLATWDHKAIEVGASTRGAKNLVRAAKIAAFLEEEEFVTPEHIRRYAVEILAHRIFMKPSERARGEFKAVGIIEEILKDVPEPKKPK